MGTTTFNSFQDYILYLYIHIAFADGVVQDSEEVLIKYKIKGLFPGADIHAKFDEAVRKYRSNLGNNEQVIQAGHIQFTNVEFYKKYKVFRDLYNIIGADGVVDVKETEAMEKLKKIIGLELSHLGI